MQALEPAPCTAFDSSGEKKLPFIPCEWHKARAACEGASLESRDIEQLWQKGPTFSLSSDQDEVRVFLLLPFQEDRPWWWHTISPVTPGRCRTSLSTFPLSFSLPAAAVRAVLWELWAMTHIYMKNVSTFMRNIMRLSRPSPCLSTDFSVVWS